MRLDSLNRWFAREESLGDLAASKGIRFGSAVATWHNDSDSTYEAMMAHHCRVLVPEAEGKSEVFSPSRGVYDFSGMDRIADMAEVWGAEHRFHALVWYAAQSQWVLDDLALGQYQSVTDTLANNVLPRLRNRCYEIDVVNEVTNDSGTGTYRTEGWYQSAGNTPAYIDYAFSKTRSLLPNARLAINDFNVETTSLYQTAKRNSYLTIIDGMFDRGVDFDVVGLQSHLTPSESLDVAGLTSFLSTVTDMGKMISITELDVVTNALTGTSLEIDRTVYNYTRQYLDLVYENSNMDTLIVWGLADKFTWWDLYYTNTRPLPFGRSLEKKPMYNAIRDFILSL